MTTAFAHAARGDLRAAALAQPMGALLAVASAAGFWAALHASVFGSRAGWLAGKLLLNRWAGILFLVLGGAAWAYKVWTFPT